MYDKSRTDDVRAYFKVARWIKIQREFQKEREKQLWYDKYVSRLPTRIHRESI